jgi:hypothetical protein
LTTRAPEIGLEGMGLSALKEDAPSTEDVSGGPSAKVEELYLTLFCVTELAKVFHLCLRFWF